MPQYVSLADQGFYQPYQLIGQNLSQYQARRDRKKERGEDISFRDKAYGDRMAQQQLENQRQAQMDLVDFPIKQLGLSEAQKATQQRAGVENFDLSGLNVPVPAEGPAGPNGQAPTALSPLDLSQSFYAQPPEAQKAIFDYARANNIPPLTAAQLYGQQSAAMTGNVPMPKGPVGMVPTKANVGGVEFGQPAPTTPPGVVHKDGRDWVFDPATQKWEAAPHTPNSKEVSQQQLNRLEALDQAERDLGHIEKQFQNFQQTGPVMGRLQYINPTNIGDRGLLEQAINAAVPNLARGVFREVGVLTDEDVKRYAQQFPTLADTPETRQRKLEALRQRIGESRKASIEMLNQAGRDMSGFGAGQPAAGSAGQPQKFDSVEAIESNPNVPAGTIALVFNPATGKYQKYQK